MSSPCSYKWLETKCVLYLKYTKTSLLLLCADYRMFRQQTYKENTTSIFHCYCSALWCLIICIPCNVCCQLLSQCLKTSNLQPWKHIQCHHESEDANGVMHLLEYFNAWCSWQRRVFWLHRFLWVNQNDIWHHKLLLKPTYLIIIIVHLIMSLSCIGHCQPNWSWWSWDPTLPERHIRPGPRASPYCGLRTHGSE